MSSITTFDDISQFQSEFWSVSGFLENCAKFCKENPKKSIEVARDVSGWVEKCLSEKSSTHTSFSKFNDTLGTVADSFSLVSLLPDIRKVINSVEESVSQFRAYFGERDISSDQPVTKSDLAIAAASLMDDAAGLICDSCDSIAFLHDINVIDMSENLSTVKTVGIGSGMFSSLKGIYDHGASLYELKNQPEEAHNEIDHQIADLKEKNHWMELTQNTAIFAFCFFSFIGTVASVAVSSTLLLTLSSIALVTTIASYFIKENAHQMQQNLIGRIVHQIN